MAEYRRCDGCNREIGVRKATGKLAAHYPCTTAKRFGPAPASTYDRVMRHVRRTRGGHLMWTGYVMPNGCALIRTGPRSRGDKGRARSESPRRIVWEHHHGPVPKFTNVRSTCGRSLCMAVEHMRIELPRTVVAAPAGRTSNVASR